MKTVSVREMKARWSAIERLVRRGEIVEVLNHGRPAVRIVPVRPRKISEWTDHLATAVTPVGRRSSEAVVRSDRDARG